MQQAIGEGRRPETLTCCRRVKLRLKAWLTNTLVQPGGLFFRLAAACLSPPDGLLFQLNIQILPAEKPPAQG
ncbi:hypothetical protein LAD77_00755 [Klebsiella pneumoniae]|nr:hypothetical protein [Klebsiella pneumoniae]